MPFDSTKEPPHTNESDNSFANNCVEITPGAGDQTDPAGRYFKYFTPTASADVTFTPYSGVDGQTVTMTCAAGYPIPGRIRRITSATATVLGWFD